MTDIAEQAAEWEYLRQLPAEHAGFVLDSRPSDQGSQYNLFCYAKPGEHRSLTVLYDRATKDFLARVTFGLTEYYDVAFIAPNFEALERVLEERLERKLDELADPSAHGYESIFQAKKIQEWDCCGELPAELSGFQLFVAPGRPVRTINGSYLVIDYSDFAASSDLAIYYNVYRDEFFGEIRVRLTPRMISLFDARELPDLTERIRANLGPVLDSLRREIGGE